MKTNLMSMRGRRRFPSRTISESYFERFMTAAVKARCIGRSGEEILALGLEPDKVQLSLNEISVLLGMNNNQVWDEHKEAINHLCEKLEDCA